MTTLMINKERRTRLAPTGVEKISKPLVMDKYNTYMGVDKADQLVIYYASSLSSKQWWKRIFFHIIDVSMVTAYVLYTNSTHGKKCLASTSELHLQKDC